MATSFYTDELIQRLVSPKSDSDRQLQDVLLNIVNPETYDCAVSDLLSLSRDDIAIAQRMVIDITTSPKSAERLKFLAEEADNNFKQDEKFISPIGNDVYIIQITNKNTRHKSQSVNLQKLGRINGHKRLRWLRERMMSKLQVTPRRDVIDRPDALKKLWLNVKADKKTLKFVCMIPFNGKAKGTTRTFSVISVGFDAAFRAALAKLREYDESIDLGMENPYRLSPAEHEVFKDLVHDLPDPSDSLSGRRLVDFSQAHAS